MNLVTFFYEPTLHKSVAVGSNFYRPLKDQLFSIFIVPYSFCLGL